MIIKKYLAKTETQAIEMAKEDLGSNAVVMNIKKISPKGLAKLFMKGKVEVTAAIDKNVEYQSSLSGSANKQNSAKEAVTPPQFVKAIIAEDSDKLVNEKKAEVLIVFKSGSLHSSDAVIPALGQEKAYITETGYEYVMHSGIIM